MIFPRKRDEDNHDRKFGHESYKRILNMGERPTNGWWWCAKEPHSTNEKWLNLGTNILLGQPSQRKVIDFVKKKLHEGFKVPFEFQEYGELAVKEIVVRKEKINWNRRLKFPSDALIDEYH